MPEISSSVYHTYVKCFLYLHYSAWESVILYVPCLGSVNLNLKQNLFLLHVSSLPKKLDSCEQEEASFANTSYLHCSFTASDGTQTCKSTI